MSDLSDYKKHVWEPQEAGFRATIKSQHDEIQRLRGEVERLRGALGIFLGSDDRFQVAVGGNPIAIERMLDEARSALANLEREG